jgi:hypothetical protein
MPEISATIDLPLPAERVWAALVTADRQGDWMPATRVRATRGDGSGIGDRIEARTGVGPLGFTDVMHVTGSRPPVRWQVRHIGPLFRGCGTFEVFALGPERCAVVWTEYVDPPLGLVGQLGWLGARRLVAAGMRSGLRRLAGVA